MNARSIQPSLLKSNATTPTAGGRFSFLKSISGEWREFSFAGIQINRCAVIASRKNKIDGAIVVEIGGDQARAGGVEVETTLSAHVRERAVAVVAPEKIVSCCPLGGGGRRLHRDVKIEVAVVVVVHERCTPRSLFRGGCLLFP